MAITIILSTMGTTFSKKAGYWRFGGTPEL